MNAIFKHWKTTSAGIGTLIVTGLAIYQARTVTPEQITALLAAIGLIFAGDSGAAE